MNNDCIHIEELTRSYTTSTGSVHALHEVSLRVQAGQFIVLMGPSGSGKTTLLNMIGALDTPTSGQAWVLGHNINGLTTDQRSQLRRQIGFIFQSFALMPTATALENVELGLRVANSGSRSHWHQRAYTSLAQLGLRAWVDHRPGELSGGQQQRVAIARALVIEPRLILADEPTGDLDSQMSVHVLRLLRRYVEQTGASCVLASHDPLVAEAADKVYYLEQGRILNA